MIHLVTLAVGNKRKKLHLEMFKRLKDLYQQYKPYVRVDLVMYAVLILLIIIYFIVSTVVD